MLNNLRYKLLALTLAVIFWVFIISTQNTFSRFPNPITIQPFNLSEQLTLATPLNPAIVTIRTTPEIYQKITVKDFEVYIDFKGLGVGEYELPVSVTPKNPDVTILKVEPAKVKIKLENLISKNVPVVLKVEGQTSDNYEVGEANLNITTVKISGAENLVKQASEALAVLQLKGDEVTDINKTLNLKIIDENLTELNNLTLAETTVNVFLPIKQVTQQKTVNITVKLTNDLNLNRSQITSSPSTVIIKGNKEILNAINQINTYEIDAEELKKQGSKKVNLNLPAGITLVNPNDILITAIFNVTENKYQKEFTAKIKLNNQNYFVNPDFIKLTLTGDQNLLSSIKETDFYVTVTLTGIETDSQKIEITSDMITVPAGTNIVDYNPKFVEVIKVKE